MTTRQYTYLQGSLHATFSELLAAFGAPIWGCDKEVCRFTVSASGHIYMRAQWPGLPEGHEDAAEQNNDWAISGPSDEILAEISDTLAIKPAHNWRITAKN